MRDTLWAQDWLLDGMRGVRPTEGLQDDSQFFSLRAWVDGAAIYQDMGHDKRNNLVENIESSFKDMLNLRCICGHPNGEIKYGGGLLSGIQWKKIKTELGIKFGSY